MQDIRLDEIDERVAIRVRRQRHPDGPDGLAVEMEVDAIDKGHHRVVRLRQRRRQRLPPGRHTLPGDPLSYVVAREHRSARARESGIPAGMIEMPVRVDDVFRLALGKLLDLREVGRRIGDELVVDQEYAVRANADPHIAASPHQHRDTLAKIDNARKGLRVGRRGRLGRLRSRRRSARHMS